MERFQNRRKNYYIKKRFQRNFIIKFCVLMVVGAVISGAIVYIMSQATVTTTFENSRLTIKSTADYILPALFLSSAIVIVVIGIATVIITLFTSHKIAGPLYRMEKDICEVAAGNLRMKFNLRSNDELKALAVSLDMMVHDLRARIEAVKSSISELEAAAAKDDKAAIKRSLEQLKSGIEIFKM